MSDVNDIKSNDMDESTADTQGVKKSKTWLFILIAVVVLALLVTGIFFLSRAGAETTGQVRDIFIILIALESLVIGAALVILVVQIAALINLLQNEIKPILESTTETINTLKGTSTFLSDNLTQPVIKLNGSLAGVKKVLELIGLFRK